MGAHTLPEDLRKAQDRYGSVDDGNDLTFSGDVEFSGTPTFTATPATILSGDSAFTGDNSFAGASDFTTQPTLVTEGTASNRGPSPLIWDDCNVLDFMINPTNGFVYFNDFVEGGYTLATGQSVTHLNRGVTGYTDTTANTIATASDEPTGVLQMLTSTDNEGATISVLGGVNDGGQIVFNTASTEQVWMEARIKKLNITDSKFNIFCGFAEEGLNSTLALISNTGALEVVDHVGFHNLEGDGELMSTVHATSGGALVTVGADVVTLVANTYIKLGMHFDGTTLTFYVNGVALADTITKTDANFPDGEELAFYLAVVNASGDNAETAIDWVRIAREF